MQGFEGLSLEGQLELSRQIKTLTLPGEMGEHFKCMALRKGNSTTPSAFDFADRTHTL
jgi:SAM-dependent MidA family methyltransferase